MLPLKIHNQIASGVVKNFLAKPKTYPDFVSFEVIADGFTVDVVLRALEPAPFELAIEASYWLCDRENKRLNFNSVDDIDLLIGREVLSEYIRWGQIRSECFSQNEVGVRLYLCIDTSDYDLNLMVSGKRTSHLLQNLIRLFRETYVVYPALYGLATGQITDLSKLQNFLGEGDERHN